MVGFISVNSKKKGEWFLNKFYINQLKAKKGIGSKVFDLLLELTNPKKITLTVNRQNYKSINFYFKKGFKIEKVADFEIGKNYVMNDFVMAWRKKNWLGAFEFHAETCFFITEIDILGSDFTHNQFNQKKWVTAK